MAEVPTELGERRLDAAVKALLGTSWNQAREWIRLGKITVNGETVTDGARAVATGDQIRHDPSARRARPETDLPPDVLVFVDRHIVVANKPAGISTVPFEEHERGAMTSRLQALLGRMRASGGSRQRGVPPPVLAVHRLDRDTSGLVVFARLQAAVEPLSAQFREHTAGRRYLALVHGEAPATTYRSHLVEDRGDGRRGSLERLPPNQRKGKGRGRLAITRTEVLERLGEATLLSCRLQTGRTHQIRIHLAEAGHPLVGEKVYVPRALVVTLPQRIPAPRMMLHAAELGFAHPVSGEPLHFHCEVPADMQEVLERLRGSQSPRR